MTDTDDRQQDDTLEIQRQPSLTDDLLTPTDTRALELDDDEFLETGAGRRSRATTALVIALIFVIGTFSGVLVSRVLSPEPKQQVVYVLTDGNGSSAQPSASATPSTR